MTINYIDVELFLKNILDFFQDRNYFLLEAGNTSLGSLNRESFKKGILLDINWKLFLLIAKNWYYIILHITCQVQGQQAPKSRIWRRSHAAPSPRFPIDEKTSSGDKE